MFGIFTAYYQTVFTSTQLGRDIPENVWVKDSQVCKPRVVAAFFYHSLMLYMSVYNLLVSNNNSGHSYGTFSLAKSKAQCTHFLSLC